MLRKRALRRLSHEQYAAYSTLYEQVLSEIPGLTRHHARGRAWTRLRYQFPDRYLELFALEQSGTDTEMPPRSTSCGWWRPVLPCQPVIAGPPAAASAQRRR